jgi:hypothetical protein
MSRDARAAMHAACIRTRGADMLCAVPTLCRAWRRHYCRIILVIDQQYRDQFKQLQAEEPRLVFAAPGK